MSDQPFIVTVSIGAARWEFACQLDPQSMMLSATRAAVAAREVASVALGVEDVDETVMLLPPFQEPMFEDR